MSCLPLPSLLRGLSGLAAPGSLLSAEPEAHQWFIFFLLSPGMCPCLCSPAFLFCFAILQCSGVSPCSGKTNLHSGITPGGLRVHIGCWGANPGWLRSRQEPYLLYYCSGPVHLLLFQGVSLGVLRTGHLFGRSGVYTWQLPHANCPAAHNNLRGKHVT